MKAYYSEGGARNPDFPYQVQVHQCTTEMYEWCEAYDDQGDTFCRFYVKRNMYGEGYDRVQFEQEQPAIMFALRFGKV